MDRQAIKRPRDQVMIGFPAASTMSRNASGPCLKETARGRNVAGECSNNNEICRYAWNPFEGSHGPGIYFALCSEVNRQRAAKTPLLLSLHIVHPILAICPANPHAGLFAARIFDEGMIATGVQFACDPTHRTRPFDHAMTCCARHIDVPFKEPASDVR